MARSQPIVHQSTLKIGIEGSRDFSPEKRQVYIESRKTPGICRVQKMPGIRRVKKTQGIRREKRQVYIQSWETPGIRRDQKNARYI